MTLPISRDEALAFLKTMPQLESDMNHYLETEAIMRAIAVRLDEDADYWAMVGLLHDIDWSLTKDNLEQHCIKSVDMLKEKGFDETFIHTVQSHGFGYDLIPSLKQKKRTKQIEHALTAAETLTGIIFAYALMRDKKITDMKVKGLKKKFKDKRFAANCNRDLVKEIEHVGLELSELFEISIKALSEIKDEIGLE